MINEIGGVVAQGFIAGIVSGVGIFFSGWILSSAMNILKFPMKGD